MLKKNINLKDFILFFIIIILIIFNITSTSKTPLKEEEEIVEEPTTEIIFSKNIDAKYNSNEKYYSKISYKKFKKKIKSSKLSTIAIIDTSSITSESFTTMINKIAYYKEETIYVLELNKLTKKELLSFQEYDERFNDLESGYIISVKNNKILSLTTFDDENIRLIIEGIGE